MDLAARAVVFTISCSNVSTGGGAARCRSAGAPRALRGRWVGLGAGRGLGYHLSACRRGRLRPRRARLRAQLKMFDFAAATGRHTTTGRLIGLPRRL